MCTIMPSPQEVRDAPEMALLTALAYSLEATQVALVASYPSLYEECGLDDDHTEQGAYARALYTQIDGLLSLLGGYVASVGRASSLANRHCRSAGDVAF